MTSEERKPVTDEMKLFEVKDFTTCLSDPNEHFSAFDCAQIANRKFQEFLSKGVRVSGNGHVFGEGNDADPNFDTHTGILVCVEPLKRGVTKSEIVKALRDIDSWKTVEHKTWVEDLADRIEHGEVLNE